MLRQGVFFSASLRFLEFGLQEPVPICRNVADLTTVFLSLRGHQCRLIICCYKLTIQLSG